ncbi:MAG: 50S ribosomal protein L13 [Bacillota bacterium]|nr:50S ribosomal protein L13 [Bacillota bacterium]NLU54665.1 50S ribosomal protein L13 [Bacillota bacterium]HOA90494.1 50S ribosomal protein L13 [Bacillota bacterium]HOP53030.1 50S ribosomal protein L13 [Bacillota bacterium]HPQ11573.1 50S ribosomal protein L13 [Bacillota bacterium]
MKTFQANPDNVERKWYLVDAEGKTLGRLASQVASIVRGKTKPTYTPHADTGDFVIIINADKINVTGDKLNKKMYYRHSGYPGGLKTRTLKQMLDKKPEEVLRLAIAGMLPRNALGRKLIKKVKIYAGPEHPHTAQNPELLSLN